MQKSIWCERKVGLKFLSFLKMFIHSQFFEDSSQKSLLAKLMESKRILPFSKELPFKELLNWRTFWKSSRIESLDLEALEDLESPLRMLSRWFVVQFLKFTVRLLQIRVDRRPSTNWSMRLASNYWRKLRFSKVFWWLYTSSEHHCSDRLRTLHTSECRSNLDHRTLTRSSFVYIIGSPLLRKILINRLKSFQWKQLDRLNF